MNYNQSLSSNSSTPKGLPQANRGFAEFQRNVTPNGSQRLASGGPRLCTFIQTLLENRINQLIFLQKTILHYHLIDLLHIILELRVAFIQYINNSNINLKNINHHLIHINHYPPIQYVPHLVLQFINMLNNDIDNNDFEEITNNIPSQSKGLPQTIQGFSEFNQTTTPLKSSIVLQTRNIRNIINIININFTYTYSLQKLKNSINSLEKKIILVNKSELDIPLNDNCSICLEIHCKKNIIECDCSHQFGKKCFKNWIITCIKSNKEITCPKCRIKVKSISKFLKDDYNSTWKDSN